MATFRDFEDIDAWQRARTLTASVFRITRTREFQREPFLCDQLKRASVSVMANIAEGFERGGSKEFVHFLSIAAASASECRSHLFVAFDSKLIDADAFTQLRTDALECNKLIRGLMNYLQRSPLKGSKFKKGPGE